MAVPILSLFLLFISIKSSANNVTNTFIDCLNSFSEPTFPINGTIYTPDNSSFSSVFHAYIRNPVFYNSTRTKPSLIITPLHVSHIQASVICAQLYGLQMRTRSGGHDYEGLSYLSYSNTPFFILDMFNLRSVDVNIEQETVWVQTGATLGEVYYGIAEKSKIHGLPGGVCPTVGVGGHCSGAGYGNMLRKYGLTADCIVDALLVDVNGAVLDRESMGEDLFWAITGGGGASFGVVLAFKFKLVSVPPQVTFFNSKRTEERKIIKIAEKWFHVAHRLDKDLFIRMSFDVLTDRKGIKHVRASFPSLFLGNSTRLLSLMDDSFPELGLQDSEIVEMSWVESALVYAGFPVGTPIETLLSRTQQPERDRPFKIKSDYLKNPISKKGLKSIFKKMKQLQNQMITFSPFGGRMEEISEFAKPFPHRAGNLAMIEYETYWDELGTEASKKYLGFSRKMHEHMTPYVSDNPREAFYNYRDLDNGVNHHGKYSYEEGKVYGIRYFKEVNYNRLVRVKTMVDPNNFFSNEQGIPALQSSDDM
ncbi:putative tetrahydroberberine oxidase [Helianthus debilis subsp. tardiflorus]